MQPKYVKIEKNELANLLRKSDELEAKLAESEKQIKDAREAGDMAVDSWCKNRRKYEAQIAEMQNKSFILYSMLYETLEKQGCEDIASQIDQMTGWTYDKEADWFKGNRNYDQHQQDKRIKELEHRLSNCIEPKFKIGQECWGVVPKTFWNKEGYTIHFKVKAYIPDNNGIVLMLEDSITNLHYSYEWQVFDTKAEAEAKLRSLEDESNND